MRGESLPTMDVRRAAVLLDLALAGVHAELGEEPRGVAGWDVPDMVAKAAVAAPVLEAVKAPAEVVAQPKPQAEAEPVAAGSVWHDGEAGGVVLVVQGSRNTDTDNLIEAMMAAVGCTGMPRAWVGAMGVVEAAVLAEEVKALEPQRILVLGQGALGVLAGRSLGVEGWQAAGGPALDVLPAGVAVGVTYPPEMLARQPLFKRLAWQHLLAWQSRFEPGAEVAHEA